MWVLRFSATVSAAWMWRDLLGFKVRLRKVAIPSLTFSFFCYDIRTLHLCQAIYNPSDQRDGCAVSAIKEGKLVGIYMVKAQCLCC